LIYSDNSTLNDYKFRMMCTVSKFEIVEGMSKGVMCLDVGNINLEGRACEVAMKGWRNLEFTNVENDLPMPVPKTCQIL
jgi:hypothetical protein